MECCYCWEGTNKRQEAGKLATNMSAGKYVETPVEGEEPAVTDINTFMPHAATQGQLRRDLAK